MPGQPLDKILHNAQRHRQVGRRAGRTALAGEELHHDRLGGLGVPTIAWANLGHGGHVQTFPLGVPAELDADARTLSFLEPPLQPATV